MTGAKSQDERPQTARERADVEVARTLETTAANVALVVVGRAQALATLALADAVENLTEQLVNEITRAQS